MPQRDDKLTTYLMVILVVVIIITFVLAGLYFSSLKKTNSLAPRTGGPTGNQTSNIQVSPTGNIDTPQVSTLNTATEFTGYIQELAQKSREIDGITYNYIIGLLGKDGNSVPIWLTDQEYASIQAFDSRRGKEAISLNDIEGGTYVRVTSVAQPDGREVILEIIN